MRNYLFILFSVLSLISCEYFKQDIDKKPIARVNESYLYEEDIKELVSDVTSKEDSILIVNNFINRWATKQLLIDQSLINLPEEKQEQFNKLVDEYRIDLFTEAYKNVIVSKQLDSTINIIQLIDFYEENKENFRLNDDLFKVRYCQVEENFNNFSNIKEKFRRFDDQDKKDLSELSIHFKSFNFNDSTWVKKEALIEAMPILNMNPQADEVLKISNFTQLQDSLGVYLIKIEDVLKTNDIAPLSHIKPTIEQIILNKRKLELLKKLDKDITKDAIKNNRFEIYTKE
jgi:hypothetical protein